MLCTKSGSDPVPLWLVCVLTFCGGGLTPFLCKATPHLFQVVDNLLFEVWNLATQMLAEWLRCFA